MLFKTLLKEKILKRDMNFKFDYLKCPNHQVEPKSHDILPEYSQH